MRRPPARRRRSHARGGLSLAESLTALAVMTVAGSAALTALTAGVHGATEAARMTVAAGLADDLADEVFAAPVRPAARRSADPGPRARFDDADDYRDWSASPPERPDGRPVGVPGDFTDKTKDADADLSQLRRFRRTVSVETVERDASGAWVPAGGDAPHRRARVAVLFRGTNGDRVLAERTAILARPGS